MLKSHFHTINPTERLPRCTVNVFKYAFFYAYLQVPASSPCHCKISLSTNTMCQEGKKDHEEKLKGTASVTTSLNLITADALPRSIIGTITFLITPRAIRYLNTRALEVIVAWTHFVASTYPFLFISLATSSSHS